MTNSTIIITSIILIFAFLLLIIINASSTENLPTISNETDTSMAALDDDNHILNTSCIIDTTRHRDGPFMDPFPWDVLVVEQELISKIEQELQPPFVMPESNKSVVSMWNDSVTFVASIIEDTDRPYKN